MPKNHTVKVYTEQDISENKVNTEDVKKPPSTVRCRSGYATVPRVIHDGIAQLFDLKPIHLALISYLRGYQTHLDPFAYVEATQDDVARAIGSSRATIWRAKKDLDSKGLLIFEDIVSAGKYVGTRWSLWPLYAAIEARTSGLIKNMFPDKEMKRVKVDLKEEYLGEENEPSSEDIGVSLEARALNHFETGGSKLKLSVNHFETGRESFCNMAVNHFDSTSTTKTKSTKIGTKISELCVEASADASRSTVEGSEEKTKTLKQSRTDIQTEPSHTDLTTKDQNQKAKQELSIEEQKPEDVPTAVDISKDPERANPREEQKQEREPNGNPQTPTGLEKKESSAKERKGFDPFDAPLSGFALRRQQAEEARLRWNASRIDSAASLIAPTSLTSSVSS